MNNTTCTCACHENKLGKPYIHDDKCCDKMNGFTMDTPDWEQMLDDALTSPATGLCYLSGDSKREIVSKFREILALQRTKVRDEVMEIIHKSKATFFAAADQVDEANSEVQKALGDGAYEMKAEISDAVGMYFHDLLEKIQ